MDGLFLLPYTFVQIASVIAAAPVFALLLVVACKTNIYIFIHVLLPQLRTDPTTKVTSSTILPHASLVSFQTIDEWMGCLLTLLPCAVLLKWSLVFWLDTFSFVEEMPAVKKACINFLKNISHLQPSTGVLCEVLVFLGLAGIANLVVILVDILNLEELSDDSHLAIPLVFFLRSIVLGQAGLIFLTWTQRLIFSPKTSTPSSSSSSSSVPPPPVALRDRSFDIYPALVKVTAVSSAIFYGIHRGMATGPIHVAAWAMVIGSLLAAVYLGCWLVFVVFAELFITYKKSYVFWSVIIFPFISIAAGLKGKTTGFGWIVFVVLGIVVLGFQLVRKWKKTTDPVTQPLKNDAGHEGAASEKTSYISVLASLAIYALVIATFILVVMVYSQESNLENTYSCGGLNSWTKDVIPAAEINLQATPRGYEICNHLWHNLNVIDYGLLADMAYWKGLQNEPCFQRTFVGEFNSLFDPSDWLLRGESNSDANVGFYDLYSASRNLSVISVRGTTSRNLDILEDADLFMEIALLEAVSFVVPIVQMSPDGLVANMVKLASLPEQWLTGSKRYYYQAVLDYVQLKCQGRQVILTGHSLGGAIATIVGSLTNHTSIAFSPPGIVYSRRKFGIRLAALEKYSINILPARDPVTKIDKHTGLVQHVSCFESNPFACHGLRRTICDLQRKCQGSKPLFCPHVAQAR